ncbi:nucleotide-binding protein, partial [Bacillus pumilus]
MNIALRFLSQGRKRLAISSPDQNEGKSTLVANLAVAAAQAGVRTVLIDANVSSP